MLIARTFGRDTITVVSRLDGVVDLTFASESFPQVAPYPPLSATAVGPTVTNNSTNGQIMTLPLTSASTPIPTPFLPSMSGVPAPTNVAEGTITNGCAYYYTMDQGFNCTWIET